MTRILTERDLVPFCTPPCAFNAMSTAFRLEGVGLIDATRRTDTTTPRGWLRTLAVSAPGLGSFGFKAMNLTKGVGVRYAIWLYSADTGELRAILDARMITGIRTAATTALATSLMSNDPVSTVAIVGSGYEAGEHIRMFRHAFPDAEFRVFSRRAESREAFAAEHTALGARISPSSRLDEALDGADVAILATKSAAPFMTPGLLKPGLHVNSIGAARLDQFELEASCFPLFDNIVVDTVHGVLHEAGDAAAAAAAGTLDQANMTALSALINGLKTVRANPSAVTLFKSVGTATQDIALASALVALAEDAGVGQLIDGFPSLKPAVLPG